MTITNPKQSVWEEFDRTFEYGMCERSKVKAFIQSRFIPKDELREKINALFDAAPEEMEFEQLAQMTKKMLAIINQP